MELLIITHHTYNYDELLLELENSHKQGGESVEDLFSKFNQNFHIFHKNEKPFGKDLFEWHIHLLSLFDAHDQLSQVEHVINYLNSIYHEMHASRGIGLLVNLDQRPNFIESMTNIETIIHQHILGFVLHSDVYIRRKRMSLRGKSYF